MNRERAHQILIHHSQDVESGFCASLRPYKGLRRDHLDEIEEAIIVVAPDLQNEQINRSLICALWGILWTARNWALASDSMLQRNNLITPEDAAFLSGWVYEIDMAVDVLLQGGPLLLPDKEKS